MKFSPPEMWRCLNWSRR